MIQYVLQFCTNMLSGNHICWVIQGIGNLTIPNLHFALLPRLKQYAMAFFAPPCSLFIPISQSCHQRNVSWIFFILFSPFRSS